MLMLCLKRNIKKQSESYHLSQYWGNGLCNARAGYDCVPRQDDVSQDRPVILIAASWPQKIHGLISREYDLAMPAYWTSHNDHYSNLANHAAFLALVSPNNCWFHLRLSREETTYKHAVTTIWSHLNAAWNIEDCDLQLPFVAAQEREIVTEFEKLGYLPLGCPGERAGKQCILQAFLGLNPRVDPLRMW